MVCSFFSATCHFVSFSPDLARSDDADANFWIFIPPSDWTTDLQRGSLCSEPHDL